MEESLNLGKVFCKLFIDAGLLGFELINCAQALLRLAGFLAGQRLPGGVLR
jgi:hypothetical protein